MAHTLYFQPRDGASARVTIALWMQRNALCQSTADGWRYANPDTGVTLQFYHRPNGPFTDLPGTDPALQVDIPYGVPSVVGREAGFAIERLSELCALDIFDPQIGAHHPVDADALAQSYAKHAGWAARALLASQTLQKPTLARAKLDAVWQWNFGQRIRKGSSPLRAPTIRLLSDGTQILRCILWRDGEPLCLPLCIDAVLADRRYTAPRRGWLRQRQPCHDFLPIAAFRDGFGDYFEPDAAESTSLRTCPGAGRRLRAALARRPRHRNSFAEGALSAVKFCDVMDREFVPLAKSA